MKLVSLAVTATLVACAPVPTVATNSAHPFEGSLLEPVVATPASVSWGAAPAILPAGAQVSILEGNPAQPGFFTLRLKMPSGYRIPPHFHPAVEHVTVLSGSFKVGMGPTFNAANMITLPAGSFGALPSRMQHYAMADGETVIQLHGIGPWSLVYVNPSDDPRNR
jgi:quercetin dioxygenase-like cupin family protein